MIKLRKKYKKYLLYNIEQQTAQECDTCENGNEMSSMTDSALCQEEISKLIKGGETKQCFFLVSVSWGDKNVIWRGWGG